MSYSEQIEKKLGFDQLLNQVSDRCRTEAGKQLIGKVEFLTEEKRIKQLHDQTAELMEILDKGQLTISLPIDFEIDHKEANSAGFFFSEDQFIEILDLLRAIKRLMDFFHDQNGYPQLRKLLKGVDADQDLIRLIERSFDVDGQIKSNASKLLETLNHQIEQAERQLFKESRSLFQKNKELGYLGDTELSIRNGRMVLPVLSEHKRKVDGLFMDQSASGKISYIEPIKLVHLNNDLSELNIQRKQEIVRILREVTAAILPELKVMDYAKRKMAEFDLIRAKAQLSNDLGWSIPTIDKLEHQIVKGKHPLLQIRMLSEKKSPVPMDLSLNTTQRMVVISGPNAGGKSVALKTVGLLQYMFQCGIPVPVSEGSRFKLFERIYVDIGDDQSIESDLSTYSSHLRAAKTIVNNCNEESLVLIDEIGTGTDPMFAGPMAQAIVETIHERGAYGVITTHFSNIKTSAKSLKHAVNGAMLFDTEKLQPLYQLAVGQAGSSFAYEVAKNIGLNKSIIKKARALTDTRQYDLDLLLAEVQQQKDQLQKEQEELDQLRKEAEYYQKEYRKLKEDLDQQKRLILQQAKQKAEQIISESNKEVERTIRTIKEKKADHKATRQAREKLQVHKSKLAMEPQTETTPDFKVGDRVQIKDSQSVGEIVTISKKKVELDIGGLRTKTSVDKIEKVGGKQARKAKKVLGKKAVDDRAQSFSTTLDVRGMRTDEAIKEVDRWIDSALILGFSELRLIHGKGYGILKKQIREHLQRTNLVDSMAYESENLGGDGVSIVFLK